MTDFSYTPKKGSLIARFLWLCAGADSQILDQCPKADQVKYQGLGGIVLATGILAFFSGSYAIYTVFRPKEDTALGESSPELTLLEALQTDPTTQKAVVIGFIWALIIFNMERFIVSSTGKGDGTDAITRQEFGQAIPRLIMAAIIAMSLSKPLEIRIMQDEINAAIQEKQSESIQQMSERIQSVSKEKRDELVAEIERITNKLDEQDKELEKRRLEIESKRRALMLEIEGTGGSGKRGEGPVSRRKKADLEAGSAELERDRAKMDIRQANYIEERKQLQQELNDLDEKSDLLIAEQRKVVIQSGGLVERIKLAHEVSPAISWAIMLLLFMIEVGPIFFKMMINRSAYDYIKDNQDMIVRAKLGIEIKGDVISKNPTDPTAGTEEVHIDRYHQVSNILLEQRLKFEAEKEMFEKMQEIYINTLPGRVRQIYGERMRELDQRLQQVSEAVNSAEHRNENNTPTDLLSSTTQSDLPSGDTLMGGTPNVGEVVGVEETEEDRTNMENPSGPPPPDFLGNHDEYVTLESIADDAETVLVDAVRYEAEEDESYLEQETQQL